jgi:sphingomyelin phosphodiesterase
MVIRVFISILLFSILSPTHQTTATVGDNTILDLKIEELVSLIGSYKNYTPMPSKLKFLESISDSFVCNTCVKTFNELDYIMEKKFGKAGILKTFIVLCSLVYNHDMCQGLADQYGKDIIDLMIGKFIDGDIICTTLKICASKAKKLEADDFARELLKDKPTREADKVSTNLAITWKVLQIADFHTDLYYKEGSLGKCNSKLCCRPESGTPQKPEDIAGKWGFIGLCDLPFSTLERFVEVMSNDINPDFIIWTGDNPSHDVWAVKEDYVFVITEKFIGLLKQYGYNKPVYPSLGNHEKVPVDWFKPDGESVVLKRFGDLYKPWLEDQAYESFIKFGFYTQKHPNSNLRIVSMNCMLCDVLNFQLFKSPTDPESGIDWLVSVLRAAEKAEEIVYIIGHIPLGDRFQSRECSKRLIAILDRFSYIIRGSFHGHTHFDEFRLVSEYFNKDKVLDLVYIAPSLTT